ncbi:hypothetical protein [Micromonospora aurantiaca (nom. illeg.)]|uniref:hypothetical protein n=1 Tax=Micromonospora aurantiaca (nom. illeg.) TaxID=47850 RepID=UPI0035ADDCC8
MSTPENPQPRPASLEAVLRDAWDAFHPGQPAPLGWLTHTAARIHDHLRTQQPTPTAAAALPSVDEQSAVLRRRVWQALRDAAADDVIAPDAADHILDTLDLPGLPRRWQIRLTLPLWIEVTATSRDDAVEAAEDAIDAALTGTGHGTYLDWDNTTRDDATPGAIDTTTDTPADLRSATAAPEPDHDAHTG